MSFPGFTFQIVHHLYADFMNELSIDNVCIRTNGMLNEMQLTIAIILTPNVLTLHGMDRNDYANGAFRIFI